MHLRARACSLPPYLPTSLSLPLSLSLSSALFRARSLSLVQGAPALRMHLPCRALANVWTTIILGRIAGMEV